eukprot:CAMPEP_0202382016 /NCGR_PEP_ID=MMETSP1127-20130417/40450_1 /ASSEMBLY_ACC=CAM_ASM_000462 /TAXON_ID=3047 /ORGANISM="Dunaliella tertiolecta, Strain CCMP1320" /LENGTH=54 /DNA_ID=CAMNT_0048981119 /DNA_START=111 /DNA_END=272 /DNA_ORIENTATION=+
MGVNPWSLPASSCWAAAAPVRLPANFQVPACVKCVTGATKGHDSSSCLKAATRA